MSSPLPFLAFLEELIGTSHLAARFEELSKVLAHKRQELDALAS